MADSIVKLTVEDSSFNAKIKAAAKSFTDFGARVASAGVDAFRKFAAGAETAKVAFQGFNAALKANALVFVITTALQAAQAIGEMVGDWISGASDAEEAQRRLNEELENTAALIKEIDHQSKFNERLARASGASTTEILRQRKADAERELDLAADQAARVAGNKNATQEDIDNAKKLMRAAEERLRKANEDIIVDNAARFNKTGEYAVRGGGGGRGGKTIKTEQTEMQMLQTRIKDLEQEYLKLGTVSTESADKRRNDIRAEIQDNEKRINQIKLLNEQSHGRLLGGDVQLPSGGASMTGNVQGIGNGLSTLPQHLSPLQEMNAELSRMKELLEMAPNTDEYQSQLQKIIDKEKEIAKFKGATDTENVAKNSAEAWRGAAAAMSSVGSALSQMEDPGAKIMGIIGEAIANIASGFAQASAQEGKGGVWYWIAATAAGLAAMVSTIATIHSATGFAQGGIVQGNTYSSDQIPARLNAGEVVLTHAMAGNLASQLEGNGLGNLNLSATISGEQIRLALNNNGRRTGRGEYVQTNFR
jgi:hypothetical protein